MKNVTKRARLYWGMLLTACCVAGCGSKSDTHPSTAFEPNKALFTTIAKADRLTLYEGVPRPDSWSDQPVRDEPTVAMHGYTVYQAPLPVSAEDAGRLKGVLGDESQFRVWRGPKACGGFNPDYLAEWWVGGEPYRVLICLTCSEVKVFGPGSTIHCDIHSDAKDKLKEMLKQHRKARPAAPSQ